MVRGITACQVLAMNRIFFSHGRLRHPVLWAVNRLLQQWKRLLMPVQKGAVQSQTLMRLPNKALQLFRILTASVMLFTAPVGCWIKV